MPRLTITDFPAAPPSLSVAPASFPVAPPTRIRQTSDSAQRRSRSPPAIGPPRSGSQLGSVVSITTAFCPRSLVVRVLILGGTKFLGRHLAEHALQAGHEVTLFNRGRTGTGLFPGVPRLIGDRTADGDPDGLTALGAGAWDMVFDFSG